MPLVQAGMIGTTRTPRGIYREMTTPLCFWGLQGLGPFIRCVGVHRLQHCVGLHAWHFVVVEEVTSIPICSAHQLPTDHLTSCASCALPCIAVQLHREFPFCVQQHREQLPDPRIRRRWHDRHCGKPWTLRLRCLPQHALRFRPQRTRKWAPHTRSKIAQQRGSQRPA
jgi:hypothetical protein